MNVKVSRYSVEITHPDKVLFGKSGLTKKDLVRYYMDVASTMMPYLEKRLISMQRFPEGITHEGFFQKDAADYFPDWIKRVPLSKEEGGKVKYVVIDKPATLIYLANLACITPHVWLSKTDNLNKPDRMIFDLDPANKLPFSAIQDVAQKIKEVLDALELPSFYMLTGSRGAHILVPLKRMHTFDEVRKFAYEIAAFLAQQFPKRITVDVHKSKRGKRVFIDWLRNSYGATAVAPYAVRPHEGAPVAAPVTWKELQKKGMISQKYTIKTMMKRVKKVGDVWKDMQRHAVSLKQAQKKLSAILKGV